MEASRLFPIVVLCIGIAAVGCRATPSAKTLALPPQIVLAPGAYDIRPEKKADGTNGVNYTVHESFPADVLLARIRAALPGAEWDPLATDWMDADMRSSHERGWGDFSDATRNPPTHVHQWMAQWRDKAGNVMFYSLRYDSVLTPGKRLETVEDRPDNDKLAVTAIWVPKATADQLTSWAASQRSKGQIK